MLLVGYIFILLQEFLSEDDLEVADVMLRLFVRDVFIGHIYAIHWSHICWKFHVMLTYVRQNQRSIGAGAHGSAAPKPFFFLRLRAPKPFLRRGSAGSARACRERSHALPRVGRVDRAL